MRSKRVSWGHSTNFLSQSLRLSWRSLPSALASTCFLQYSRTLSRIRPFTFGMGTILASTSSSTICLIVSDSKATAISITNSLLSELLNTTFFISFVVDVDDDIVSLFKKNLKKFCKTLTLSLSLSFSLLRFSKTDSCSWFLGGWGWSTIYRQFVCWSQRNGELSWRGM